MPSRKTSIVIRISSAFFISCGILSAGTPVDSLKTTNGGAVAPAVKKSNVQQIIFEEQKIEGKIRRPQLVLIKADQRPEFTPMVMHGSGNSKSVSGLIDEDLVGHNENNGPFKFDGTKIVYAAP